MSRRFVFIIGFEEDFHFLIMILLCGILTNLELNFRQPKLCSIEQWCGKSADPISFRKPPDGLDGQSQPQHYAQITPARGIGFLLQLKTAIPRENQIDVMRAGDWINHINGFQPIRTGTALPSSHNSRLPSLENVYIYRTQSNANQCTSFEMAKRRMQF